jgi:hypothetical protein
MTIQDVALILQNRKNSANSFLLDSVTRDRLGFDGFAFAKERGWIELDDSTQCMRVSMKKAKLAEIQAEALRTGSSNVRADSPVTESAYRDTTLLHVAEYDRGNSPSLVMERVAAQQSAPAEYSGPNPAWREFLPVSGEASPMHTVLEDGTNLADDALMAAARDQVSMERFRKPFSQCTPQEQQSILGEMQQKSAAQASSVQRSVTAPPATPPTPSVNSSAPAAPGVGK